MKNIGPNFLSDDQVRSVSKPWSDWEDLSESLWLRVPAPARWPIRLTRLLVQACLTRVPVVWYRGPSHPSGRIAKVLVAGAEPWVKYLPARFFATAPQREPAGTVPVWALPGVLYRLRTSADVTIARVDCLSARLFFDATYLSVPEWAATWLTLPDDPYALVRGNGNVREDLRRIRRYRLEPELSHRETDFDLFYSKMYRPYVRSRYGELAALYRPVYLRHFFHRGGIVFVQKKGQRVAGQLFARDKQEFTLVAIGADTREAWSVRNGALAACYFFGIMHAHALGCTRLSFGGSRPVLQDGVLRFKGKWRAGIKGKQSSESLFMVHWNRLDGVAGEFLSHTSLMFRDSGGLSAIHSLRQDHPATQADAMAARHLLWIDGLRHLYLVSPAGWSRDLRPPPQTTLLDSGIRPESLQAGKVKGRRCL